MPFPRQIDANVTRKPVAEIKARLHGASCLFLWDELPCSNLRGPVKLTSAWGHERGTKTEAEPVCPPSVSFPRQLRPSLGTEETYPTAPRMP